MLSSTKLLAIGYSVPIMRKKISRTLPRETLIKNLRFLMKKEKLSEDMLGKRSGVAQKTINNILNGESSPTIDTLDKLAGAFGLNSWHLILQDLPENLIHSPSIAKLYKAYISASEEGRELIDHVAAREAQTQYKPKRRE